MDQDQLLSKLTAVAEGTPYPTDAYLFVLRGMEFANSNVPRERWQRDGDKIHLDATDICWSLIDYAGSCDWEDPRGQFELWNIRSSSDFGNMIYRLIDAELAAASDADQRSDFEGIFSVSEALASSHHETVIDESNHEGAASAERNPSDFRPPQFSLRWLLVVATVVGISVLLLKWDYGYRQAITTLAAHRAVAINAEGEWISVADYTGPVKSLGILTPADASAIAALNHFPRLETLMLNEVDADAFAGRHEFPRIRQLSIHRTTDETLPQVVERFPNVEQLTVSSLFGPTRVVPLTRLAKLKSLSLFSPLAAAEELKPLQQCPQLESLSLAYVRVPAEAIDDLIGCSQLTRLTIKHASVDEAAVDAMLQLPQLRELELYDVRIEPMHAERLRNWKQLTEFAMNE